MTTATGLEPGTTHRFRACFTPAGGSRYAVPRSSSRRHPPDRSTPPARGGDRGSTAPLQLGRMPGALGRLTWRANVRPWARPAGPKRGVRGLLVVVVLAALPAGAAARARRAESSRWPWPVPSGQSTSTPSATAGNPQGAPPGTLHDRPAGSRTGKYAAQMSLPDKLTHSASAVKRLVGAICLENALNGAVVARKS
jgi:hypothetical protein